VHQAGLAHALKSPPNPHTRPRPFISPTHKRTEGRAPVWGSEFTSKDAALQGRDTAETAARLNVKLWVLVTARW